jgi:DNA-binding NarL/FixJ family response regulator
LVLVESQALLRDGLAHSISAHIREAVVECYGRVEDVVPGPATLVLIGVDPRRNDAAESVQATCQTLRGLCGEAPIGAVLRCDDAALRRTLGALGIAGVVQHEASLAVAIAAIQLMWVGGSCFPPDLSRDDEYASARFSPSEALEPAPVAMAQESGRKNGYSELPLTSRECDVLRFLREGRQNKIIAFELGISESTVKVHLRNMMKKLNASNRTQVALGAGLDG